MSLCTNQKVINRNTIIVNQAPATLPTTLKVFLTVTVSGADVESLVNMSLGQDVFLMFKDVKKVRIEYDSTDPLIAKSTAVVSDFYNIYEFDGLVNIMNIFYSPIPVSNVTP